MHLKDVVGLSLLTAEYLSITGCRCAVYLLTSMFGGAELHPALGFPELCWGVTVVVLV